MGKSRPNIAVNVTEDQVLAAIFKVKPTADMPRPGAQRSTPKKSTTRKRSK